VTDSAHADYGPNRATLYSAEAEAAVLGSVLINPDALTNARLLLQADYFYLHKNRWVWGAFVRLADARQPIDTLTVSDELERRHQLDEIGGTAYLTHLINTVPTSIYVEAYAHIVRRQAVRRGLLEIASETANAAYAEDLDVADFTARLVTRLLHNMEMPRGAVPIAEVVSEVYDELQLALEHPTDLIGYSTGLADLDHVTGGLQTPQVFFLTGKSGIGKSRLAGQLAFDISRHTALAGTPVAYYAMEMQRQRVVRRQLARMSSVPTRTMLTGRVADARLPELVQAIADLSSGYQFYISDNRHWTTAALRADLTRLTQEHGVKVVMLDYLEKLKDAWSGDADWGRSAMLSDRVTDIAYDLGLHLMVVQRMTKAGFAATVAGAEHMSGSGQLIHDADVVGVLNDFTPVDEAERYAIPESDRRNMVTLIFDKVREEALARHVHLVCLPGLPAFGNYMPDPLASVKASVRSR
jgi:replicative DNA helicase